MAVPTVDCEYGAVRKESSKFVVESLQLNRAAMVAVAMLLAMAAILALLGSSTAGPEPTIDIGVSPDDRLERLMEKFVHNGKTMSLQDMQLKLDSWRHDPNTLLDLPEHARTQVLMRMAAKMGTMSLAESSVCASKDEILDKFAQLLRRLGGEELRLNITNAQVIKQWKAATEAYLDSESTYRLTVQKTEQAKEGAAYAQQQYEKESTQLDVTKSSYATLKVQDDASRAGLLAEQALIQSVMQMIGDLNSTTSTKAKGVSELYERPTVSMSKLQAEISKLEQMSSQKKNTKMSRFIVKLKSSLKQFGESDQITMILKQMLQDIMDRLRIINNFDATEQAQINTLLGKVTEWQTKLVDLSDAEDQANAEAEAEALQRETLAGKEKAAETQAKEETSAYKLTLPPYMKEIYIIILIQNKIETYCAEQASAASDAAAA